MQKINLLNLDLNGIQSVVTDWGWPKFRAGQIFKWLHYYGVTDFASMTNISLSNRQYLEEHCEISYPKIDSEHISSDGTIKWIIKSSDNNKIETVYIPAKNRGTLCISSQVGCVLDCKFCATGKQGFNRNLSCSEIIGQLWLAVRVLSSNNSIHDGKISNVVFMGMGEPMLNFKNVMSSVSIMLNDMSYGLSKNKVTLSTSGIVPGIVKMPDYCDISLAISLHAPNDLIRSKIMPINKKYPLEVLFKSLQSYTDRMHKRKVTFEYVMLKGINDTLENAKELYKLVRNIPSKINLIPFNTFSNSEYKCTEMNKIKEFRNYLVKKGYIATIRQTRGDDVSAACGQLVGKVIDKTNRAKFYSQKYRLN